MAKLNQDCPEPIDAPVLGELIVKISDGMTQLLKSGLNRKAIIVLLKDATKLGATDIGYVLNALENLKKDYCR